MWRHPFLFFWFRQCVENMEMWKCCWSAFCGKNKQSYRKISVSIHPPICLWKLSQHTLGLRWGTSWAGCQSTTGLTQTSVEPIKFCVFQCFSKPLLRGVAIVLKMAFYIWIISNNPHRFWILSVIWQWWWISFCVCKRTFGFKIVMNSLNVPSNKKYQTPTD